jgi:hypothetical protein
MESDAMSDRPAGGLASLRRSRALRGMVACTYAAAMLVVGFSHKAHAAADEVMFALEIGALGVICQRHPDGVAGLLAEAFAPCDFCLLTGTAGSAGGVAGRLRGTRSRSRGTDDAGAAPRRHPHGPSRIRPFVPLAAAPAVATLQA